MASLMPNGKQQYFNSNGDCLAGGKIYTYAAGTSAPKATYTSADASVQNANPVILNARGEASIFWSGAYKIAVHDASDVLVYTADNCQDAASLLAASSGASLVGFIQDCAGAEATTVQEKLRQHVTIFDFMTAAEIADVKSGNTLLDHTSALQKAVAASRHVELPAKGGWAYKFNQVTLPNTLKSLTSRGKPTIVPGAAVPTGATAADWITASTLLDAEISGLRFSVPVATYPNLVCLSMLACVDTEVHNNRFEEAGSVAIYGGNCVGCTISKNRVKTFMLTGIKFEGASQGENTAIDNRIDSVVAVAHGISFQLGYGNSAIDNVVRNVQTFGVSMYQVGDGQVLGNKIYNTKREAINTEDSSCVTIKGNTCRWDAVSQSTDFGISVYGNAAATQFNIVEGNSVTNAGDSGIALAENVSYNVVRGNTITNCNRTGIANHAGVLMYGTNCVKNVVKENIITDSLGTLHKYGVAEINFGTGAPTLNEIAGNRIEGFVTADIVRTGTTTSAYNNSLDLAGYRTYTPVVTAGAGTLTTASATGFYREVGDIVDGYMQITITTNGTGSNSILATLPFMPTRGSGGGKEIAIGGKQLSAEITNAVLNLRIVNYDNTYPAVNGSVLHAFFSYERT